MALCLVTGGAGFIGSHLVDALVANGHTVRVLDDFSTGSPANLAQVRDRIELITGDVTDLQQVREAVQSTELIFHQAARSSVQHSVTDPLTTHQVCANGTLNVLLAAREAHVRRVIYAGCASAYGDTPTPQHEQTPLQPISPYAVAKVTGEHYCAAFSSVYGLETVRLRYFSVFGTRQRFGSQTAPFVPLAIEALLGGRRPVIYGDGLQTRDFTSVEDVVQANLLAAEASRASGRVYNIGSGKRTSLLELVERINTLLDTDLRSMHTLPRPGDIRHSQADITRAQADLGYCPCTDLDHDLRSCIDYYAAKRPGPKHLRRAVHRVG